MKDTRHGEFIREIERISNSYSPTQIFAEVRVSKGEVLMQSGYVYTLPVRVFEHEFSEIADYRKFGFGK